VLLAAVLITSLIYYIISHLVFITPILCCCIYYSYAFQWYNKLHPGRMLTVRDLISWVDFLIAMEESLGPKRALLHGVFLVLLDGLNLGIICLLMIFIYSTSIFSYIISVFLLYINYLLIFPG